ncbi:MAG TPA: serine hydrolase domain-containing protein [Kofleriaceae bacterium]
MLDHTLSVAVAENRIVGAISVVMRAGRIVYETAVGLADREDRRPMQVTTPHRLASLTKPVTALATLALIDRGVLALEDRVDRFLEFRPRFGDATPPITIYQLLTHTSGLSYRFMEAPGGPYHQAGVSDGLAEPGLALAENLRRLASVPLIAAPGTAWNYSLSFDVLGAIIEKLVDAPLDRALARLITGPLDLDLSFAPREGFATPYFNAPGEPQRMFDGVEVPSMPPNSCTFAPSRVYDAASYPSGGAGMTGTAREYARFLEALRTRKVPVRAELVDQMFRDQIPELEPVALYGFGNGYGFAIRRPSTPSPLLPGAVRWGGAYGHAWFISGDTVSVLLTNTAFEGMSGQLRTDVEREVSGYRGV